MSRFKADIKVGSYVKQGEVIGYVTANAYESALLQELENKFHIKQKRLYPEEKTSNDILEGRHQQARFFSKGDNRNSRKRNVINNIYLIIQSGHFTNDTI